MDQCELQQETEVRGQKKNNKTIDQDIIIPQRVNTTFLRI